MDEKDATEESYNRVAAEYATRMQDELAHKPLDRELLDRFAAHNGSKGLRIDLGSGPGQVAAYLHNKGVEVIGIDLSPGMVSQARAAHPEIEFRQGDMRHLDLPDGSVVGITAFYSIIHIPRAEVAGVLREMLRVLSPSGLLLLAFHKGDEIRHLDEFFGQPVKLDFLFFTVAEMECYLTEAGFHVDEIIERKPYAGFEVETQRVYIFARKTVPDGTLLL